MFSILKALFDSILDKLFPPKTAADEHAADVEAYNNCLRAQAKAAANSPTSMEKLIEEQRKGDV